MPAEPAAATGVTEETQANGASSPEQSNTRQEQPHTEPIGGRLGEILAMMDIPEDVARGTLQPTKNESTTDEEDTETGDTSESDPGARGEEDEQREENRPPQGQQAPPVGEPAADELSEEQRKTWPAEALGRIHKTTAQREKFKTEAATERQARTAAEARAQELEQRLQQQPPPPTLPPTQDDPLADVQTPDQLQQAVREFEALHEWTTLNPNGVENVPTGQKDAQGNPITRDFSAEEVARRRVFAERALRRIPEKQQYIQNRQQFDGLARQIYPDVFNPTTEEGKIAQQLQTALPEIFRFTDGSLWLARAVRQYHNEMAEQQSKAAGKTVVQQHGRTAPSSTVEKLLRKHPPIAPSVPTARGTRVAPARDEGDVKAATDRFVTSGGNDEALEDMVSALRDAQKPDRNGSRAPAMA